MRTAFLALIAAIATNGLAQNKTPDKAPDPKPTHTLWAAISTNKPVHYQPKDPRFHEKLVVHFGLVNDGKKTVDPKIGKSHLLINGVEPKDWNISINNGPRDTQFEALPPGENLQFTIELQDFFTEPGIYKVVWNGKDFESPVMTLRVLPAKPWE